MKNFLSTKRRDNVVISRLRGLDLFSGIGGISYALREHIETIAYCECERYCQGILFSNMAKGSIEKAPIWDDVKTFDGKAFYGQIDIIFGGFPCQDISVAGKGKGLDGERSGLFFEILRLAQEIKPAFLLLENVPAITTRGGLQVVKEIAEIGYDCRWCVISAASIGALHRRERWFLLAYSKHNGALTHQNWRLVDERSSSGQRSQEQTKSFWKTKRASCLPSDVANSHSKGLEGQWKGAILSKKKLSESCNKSTDDGNSLCKPSGQANSQSKSEPSEWESWRRFTRLYWSDESRNDWRKAVMEVCRNIDGVSAKLDYNTPRLKGLGNSVVPCQVKEAFEILMGIKK